MTGGTLLSRDEEIVDVYPALVREPRGLCLTQDHARVRGLTRRGTLADKENIGSTEHSKSTFGFRDVLHISAFVEISPLHSRVL